ncbi:T9SS outer membrane translocon Sov/SprA [Pedobacter rhizosphaerae]|uniref:Protein involved in gliding motility SprA n=1 Tax=Pedobacter rhizosphaerae TaxID=390241 RepID=A0A1H9UZK2_9SPHI|nr:cell surface protein SprA [Pedobacter rhizosphaerae]SES14463.1 protein involved in gliding motility SprA [Pedobacter rhizosphaerae]
MKRISTLLFLIPIFLLASKNAFSQVVPSKTDTATSKNNFSLREKQLLGLSPSTNPFYPLPSSSKRLVEYDAKNKRYIVKELIGDKYVTQTQYLTVDEYQRLMNSEIKRGNWRSISNAEVSDYRSTGIIPPIQINSKSFEKLFGGSTIDIQPRGEAELTFLGRINKNENPLFNERQRVQTNFDFNQRIQMDLVGNIGTKLKIKSNYNTEAQFDFENQIKLDYTGGPDDIIQKIEAGNVSLPLNTSLITGTQALFGVKTQLKFGKLNVTSVYTQQKSESRELRITNGAQQNTTTVSIDNYEANKHYFLAQYFRNNYNKYLANAPIITSPIQITKIEVWITNKAGSTTDSRDVLGLLDLGENQPYNPLFAGNGSALPGGTTATGFPQQSNNLLASLPAAARFTNDNAVINYFQSSGGTDNFAKLIYARKLTEREFTFQPQLGYISLNNPLNADEVLAVAYRYTYNGVEYQVGEFSTDVSFDSGNPKMLYAKLLKNETTKIALPTWDLMMKNIYSIGGYQISTQNFRLDIYRIDNGTGVENPVMTEGQNTANKQWIALTEFDRLNQQNERQPDGIFDFVASNNAFGAYSTSANATNTPFGSNLSASGLSSLVTNTNKGYITIDPANGRIIFPIIEPFGKDLAARFLPSEQALVDKYTFTALYDSTQTIAKQLFQDKNRYIIKVNYQSEISSEFSLNAINVPEGSVKVFAGTMPLTEGVDFTVDYQGGRVSIINQALLVSGQPIRITTENNELFGLQQKSLFGTRLDYRVNNKLNLGGTFMNLTEKPLTQKVNIGDEPISNTIWGADINYSSPSRFLTKLVDKLPFISTKVPSSVTFYGEFAQLVPGHPRALNFAGSENGVSYLDDFEASRSVIDLKSAIAWQLSGTPQMFSESQLVDDLAYGYNRARVAFYNIDPTFYNSAASTTPANIRNNRNELSNHYVREIIEQEVFPFKETATGQALNINTLDVAYYPTVRGPYNFRTSGFKQDGSLLMPQNNWGGFQRKIETNDFEALNVGFIEFWVLDPFIYKPNSTGGDVYFNLGNISEDILKDGRKSLENGLPATDDPSKYDETKWGRVPKLQPVIQAFDNDPNARRAQDVGLDGLSDANERAKFAADLNIIKSQLSPAAAAALEADPSSDNYTYFRGPALDQINAGILKRYEKYNGPEGNSKTSQQSQEELGLENSASTSLPDGEDINRDNNMTQSDEYFQYKVSMRPADLVVGQNFITDKVTSQVKLANGNTQAVSWYQFRIPIGNYQQKVGGIQDFKSIRFIRMFMTNFTDTAVMRFAKLQLIRGEWRAFNSLNEAAQVIVDPSLPALTPDNSTIEVSTVNIEENGKRSPIPYVTPPGILRERDYSNYRGDTRLNEQSLSVTVKNLRDGYGRAAFKTAYSDFRSYKHLEMYVHAEAVNNQPVYDKDVSAFLRIGTDNLDNYYEYVMPLKITNPGTSDPDAIWPEANRMDIDLTLFQNAKLARNNARQANGQPWPINVPFTYSDGTKTIVVKGQPDMSKVRVYMLGVKNPVRNLAQGEGDDGLDKTVLVWFNELRLTEFDERGGWAATARLNLKLADFADVNISGSKSTIGFGTIDSKVSERNRADNVLLDVSSSVELGKFLPQKSGVKIPMFVSYSKQVSTPQFNPRTPDIELKNALDNSTKEQKDSILNFAQDYTIRRGINFTNVRKERTNTAKPVHLWDIENFSASYAYTQYNHRDFINQSSIQNTYRASLQYNYSKEAKTIAPFEKIIKSNMLAILKDFNFSIFPSAINFRIDVDRLYSENTLRNNDPNNTIGVFRNGYGTTFNKNFTMSRIYGIAWNLTRSLQLDFNATNYSIIDEPNGRIEGLKRDTVWENLKRLGRTTDYNHNLNVTYNLPIDKIPGLNWVVVKTRYGTNFNWQTEPLATLRDPNINLGNTVQNSRTVQVNPTLNLTTLYNKFGFVRKSGNSQEGGGIKNFFINLLTSLKNVNAAYTQTKGTFLPGYLPKTSYFGIDNVTGAPGLGFVFGSQRDIRDMALGSGWLTTDTLQTQFYVTTLREDLSLTGQLEPFKDLRITLKANKAQTKNFSSNFRYVESQSGFENLSATTQGDYSISYIAIGTAFKESNSSTISTLFEQFMANRILISRRLGAQNPNSSGSNGGFADGYSKESQDVIISAFMAAYAGKDPNKISMNAFPKIPLPNWNLTYSGLTRIPFVADRFSSVDIRHGYRSAYNVNGFNSLIRYTEVNGFSSNRDANNNFLPEFQFAQVTVSEYFSPLVGVDTRFKNNLTASFELNRSRLLALSLSNSQLAQLSENNMVFGLGYRTNKFRFPFGMFKSLKMDNNMDFKLDVAIRDNKTVIHRADVKDAEVSSGAKNITLRPSVDYVLNQKFNIKLFYDSNITKPYTSQTFNTSFSNFGFSLRFTLN